MDRHAALQGLGEVLKKPYLPSLVMFYVDDFLIWFDCAETDVQSGIKDSPKTLGKHEAHEVTNTERIQTQ